MVARNTRIGIYADNEPVLQVVPDIESPENGASDSPPEEIEEIRLESRPEPEPVVEPEPITEPESVQSASRRPVQEQLNLSGLSANPPVPESDKEVLYRIVRTARSDIAFSLEAFANPMTARGLIENAIAINEQAIAFLVDQTRVRAVEFSIAKTLILARINASLTNALNCYDSDTKTVGDASGYISNAYKLMEKL